MSIRQTCGSVVISSVLLSFVGCSLWGPGSSGEAQSERSPSTSLAGAYSDVGSNGSIQPHPEASYPMTHRPKGRTDGEIILGGPAPMPDLSTGKTIIKGSPGGTTPSPDSVRDSGGTLGRSPGADRK